MTAEASSAVSTGESSQSVVDATLPRRPLLAPPGGPDGIALAGSPAPGSPAPGSPVPGSPAPGSDGVLAPVADGLPLANGMSAPGASGAAAPDEVFPSLSNGTGMHPNGSSPNGTGPAEGGVAGSDEVETVLAESDVAVDDTDLAETDVVAEPVGAEPEAVDELIDAEPDVAEPLGAEVVGTEPDVAEPVGTEPVGAEPVGAEPVEVGSRAGDQPVTDEVVAAEVAEQLGSVVGDDDQADPAEFAAAAVLDVLRASGWADATEATELRAEATRLRELLAEVIRDHRAREASAAGGQNQQLYWLVPLLRAAHGVAFGSLGAKVALRTAVQEVPPEVLASAGLRIDYGVEPAYDDHQ